MNRPSLHSATVQVSIRVPGLSHIPVFEVAQQSAGSLMLVRLTFIDEGSVVLATEVESREDLLIDFESRELIHSREYESNLALTVRPPHVPPHVLPIAVRNCYCRDGSLMLTTDSGTPSNREFECSTPFLTSWFFDVTDAPRCF